MDGYVYHDVGLSLFYGIIFLLILLVIAGLIVYFVIKGSSKDSVGKATVSRKICKQCGSVIETDSQFCAACGNPAANSFEQVISSNNEKVICKQCGSPIKSGAKFCRYCGGQQE